MKKTKAALTAGNVNLVDQAFQQAINSESAPVGEFGQAVGYEELAQSVKAASPSGYKRFVTDVAQMLSECSPSKEDYEIALQGALLRGITIGETIAAGGASRVAN